MLLVSSSALLSQRALNAFILPNARVKAAQGGLGKRLLFAKLTVMNIKICGLFRDDDIDFVNDAKADFAGFVFAKSKRQVDEETAAKLRKKLNGSIIPVGVFADTEIETIARLHKNGIISIAQLHGSEDARYIRTLKDRCAIPLIKAVKLEGANAGEDFKTTFPLADYFLFDSNRAGSGAAFDWGLLAPYSALLEQRGFLAGGITCDNIQNAIKTRPYCIDVSSGAETNGVKDREKIMRLVESVTCVKAPQARSASTPLREYAHSYSNCVIAEQCRVKGAHGAATLS
jgi:phosphoribosylanthranilate isomerase